MNQKTNYNKHATYNKKNKNIRVCQYDCDILQEIMDKNNDTTMRNALSIAIQHYKKNVLDNQS